MLIGGSKLEMLTQGDLLLEQCAALASMPKQASLLAARHRTPFARGGLRVNR
jgi:hypothetical protein